MLHSMSGKNYRFAVVDLETTGGMPKRDRIIEVGIVLLNGTKIKDKYNTLIDPERSIPREITRITGITDEMVLGKPKFYEVAKDIVEWTDGAIFVAHNVRFDYNFLQEEYRQLGYTFSKKLLCTARLSRSMHPWLKSHSLAALIQHFGINVKNRHRALDDALATAQLLAGWIANDEAHTTVHSFINLGVKESKLPPTISMEELHSLPEQTGVYYFYNRQGELIYIGKAKDIKRRVMQHFAAQNPKAQRMQAQVADIQYQTTVSELEALITESIEIKKYKPSLNKALRNSSFPFAVIQSLRSDGVLHFKVMPESKIDFQEHRVCGYYSSSKNAAHAIQMVIDEFGLCKIVNESDNFRGPCYDHQIGKCLGFCDNKITLQEYNQHASDAFDVLHKIFPRDLIFTETSPDRQKTFAVLVKNGMISHFGCFDANDEGIRQVESLENILKPVHKSTDETTILRNYLKKHGGKGVVYLDGTR